MERLDNLDGLEFDLTVIGGGCVGAGVARDAALRGLKTLLVEQEDFGSGASSRTSKIIHGGIRYLEQGDFSLVSEALRERFILERAAPHLVQPVRFLIPVYKKGPRPLWMVRLGLFLYDLLSLFRNPSRFGVVGKEKTLALLPSLNPEALEGAGIYYDSRMNDSRLVLETVLSAREAGAVALNYVKAVAFKKTGNKLSGVVLRDILRGSEREIRCGLFVNATGPWGPEVSDMAREASPVRVRMTRGTHIIVPSFTGDDAVVVSPNDERRIFFVIPWFGKSLIGTTDIDYQGDPGAVRPTREEISYLLKETRYYFPGAPLEEKNILFSFAGIRPLLDCPGIPPSKVSRHTRITENRAGLISVIGGKFTTYRSTAEKVVDRVSKWLLRTDLRGCQTREFPLYGGNFPRGLQSYLNRQVPLVVRETGLEEASVRYLIGQYGTRSEKMFDWIRQDRKWGEKVLKNFPAVRAEVRYAVEHEMARTLDDFVRRRSRLALEGILERETFEKIAKWMASYQEWDQARIQREVETALSKNSFL